MLKYQMTLSQTRQAIVEEFTERTASGEGRIRFYNQIEEINWLEKALNDYTQSIFELVEEKCMAGFPRDKTYEKHGFTVHNTKEAMAFNNGWKEKSTQVFKALNDIKEELQK